MGLNMDRKVRPFYVSTLFLLLCLDLQLLYGIAARPIEVNKLVTSVGRIDSKAIARTSLWTMMHSGPSPGGKGHMSRTEDGRILRKLKDSGPSPGIGH